MKQSSNVGLQLFSESLLSSPIRSITTLNSMGIQNLYANRSVFLTFDDGPDPKYTKKILDVLADYNAKATFFVLGEAAEKFPDLLERMLESGHAIGNHTHSHSHPWMISSQRARYEVRRASLVIRDIAGVAPRWFRPPFGRLRRAMHREAQAQQMATVLWSRSAIDWGMLGTEAGISRRLERVEPGDIVLMHDGKREHNHPESTYHCLPKFLNSLAARALVPCSLDDVF